MFVKCSRAYEVLSDDDKRNVYNKYGEEGLTKHESKQRSSGGGFHPFGNMFGFGGQRSDDAEKRGAWDLFFFFLFFFVICLVFSENDVEIAPK